MKRAEATPSAKGVNGLFPRSRKRTGRVCLGNQTIQWLLTLAATAIAFSYPELACAQGTVNFANRVSGVLITHVYGPVPGDFSPSRVGNAASDYPPGTTDWTGFPRLSGSNYLAQLRAAPGANATDSALRWALSPPTSFRTGSGAGVLAPTTAILDGVPKDAAVATLQMFVWDNTSGLYPDAASALGAVMRGCLLYGFSPKFNLNAIGGDLNAPPNLLGLVSFNIYTLRGLPPIPQITWQPSSQVADAGSDVSFFVQAVYYPPIPVGPITPYDGPYQWFFQGAPIAGATNSALTLSKVQAKDAGGYYVQLTGPCGSTFSATAQLTVTLKVRGISGGLNPDGFHLTVLSDPGLVYHVDVSTNLLDWSTLTWVTNLLGSNTIVDPWSPDHDRRFYRAKP